MKAFNELGVKLTRRFQGDRIKIEKIEGDEVIVVDFEIRKSKLKKENDPTWAEGENECLYLQLKVNDHDRVMWGNYKFLIDQVKQIDKENLPFKAKIINEHGWVFK